MPLAKMRSLLPATVSMLDSGQSPLYEKNILGLPPAHGLHNIFILHNCKACGYIVVSVRSRQRLQAVADVRPFLNCAFVPCFFTSARHKEMPYRLDCCASK